MLKNKAFVKILVSVCLSVTMIGALCLPLFAAMPHEVIYTDDRNNMQYRRTVDGTMWSSNSGYVTAATGANVQNSNFTARYETVFLEVTLALYTNSSNAPVASSNANSDIESITSSPETMTGPTMSPPDGFDYAYTTHSVYYVPNFETSSYRELIWFNTGVYDVEDFY